jgi:hypothetical protein
LFVLMMMTLGSALALIYHLCVFPPRVLGQVLRLILVLTSGPLFLPLCNGLARVFTCAPNTDWLHTTLPCYGPAHSALVIGGGALLLALWALVFAGAPIGIRPSVNVVVTLAFLAFAQQHLHSLGGS